MYTLIATVSSATAEGPRDAHEIFVTFSTLIVIPVG